MFHDGRGNAGRTASSSASANSCSPDWSPSAIRARARPRDSTGQRHELRRACSRRSPHEEMFGRPLVVAAGLGETAQEVIDGTRRCRRGNDTDLAHERLRLVARRFDEPRVATPWSGPTRPRSSRTRCRSRRALGRGGQGGDRLHGHDRLVLGRTRCLCRARCARWAAVAAADRDERVERAAVHLGELGVTPWVVACDRLTGMWGAPGGRGSRRPRASTSRARRTTSIVRSVEKMVIP